MIQAFNEADQETRSPSYGRERVIEKSKHKKRVRESMADENCFAMGARISLVDYDAFSASPNFTRFVRNVYYPRVQHVLTICTDIFGVYRQ